MTQTNHHRIIVQRRNDRTERSCTEISLPARTMSSECCSSLQYTCEMQEQRLFEFIKSIKKTRYRHNARGH